MVCCCSTSTGRGVHFSKAHLSADVVRTHSSVILGIIVANERWGEFELYFFRASGQLVLSFSKKIATIER
jgi:hypothetical protein